MAATGARIIGLNRPGPANYMLGSTLHGKRYTIRSKPKIGGNYYNFLF
mgnify:CR=1 FL=1